MSTATLKTAKSAKAKLGLTLLGLLAAVAVSAMVVYAANRGPDFKLSASPSRATAQQGQSATYKTKITPVRKFKAPISLSVAGLPSGARASWKLADGRSLPRGKRGVSVLAKGKKAATLSIATGAATPSGSYQLAIKGVGGRKTHTKKVRLAVTGAPQPGNPGGGPGPGTTPPAEGEKKLSVVATPASRSILPGEQVSYTLDVSRTNFTGAVDLGVSGLPAGATSSFSPASPVSGGSTTLTVNLPNAATPTPKSYDLTVTGNGGGVSGAASTTLVVENGQGYAIGGSATTPLLSPGVTRPIDLTFTNPNDFAINVSALSVQLGATSNESACAAADNYEVSSQYSGPTTLTIPAHTTAASPLHLSTLVTDEAQWPHIRMLNLPTTSQDGCKGVSVNLNYTGSATR